MQIALNMAQQALLGYIMEQQKFNMSTNKQLRSYNPDLRKCHCESPGYCPVFCRVMGTSPPDWKWCQKSSEEDKRVFYDLVVENAPKTENHKMLMFFDELEKKNIPKNLRFHFYLSMSEKYHLCIKAQEEQIKQNQRILEHISNDSFKEASFDRIHILCLGHNQDQFDSIENRSYLEKFNINKISAGKHSGNEWAESRAFISTQEIFPAAAEFVGVVTASWNLKYEPFSKIDSFHLWDSSKILLNSREEDKILVCADIFCPCIWFNRNESVLTVFFGDNYKKVGEIFERMFGLTLTHHKKVPFSNQIITHRNHFNRYCKFLRENNIFDKVIDFLSICKEKKYIKSGVESYTMNRLNGYILEMISTFWFLQEDFLFMPSAERRNDWYHRNLVNERAAKWKVKTS